MCLEADHVSSADVVDHIVPHKGDEGLFWDRDNWQALCKRCHDSDKHRVEIGAKSAVKYGEDGWPL